MAGETRKIDMIVVHCSDSDPKRTTLDDIRQWHIARGFHNIGYHWVVNAAGAVQQGRRESETGAHCHGDNANSIGVCLIGKDTFTEAQFEALHELVAEIKTRYGLSNAAVWGHRDRPSGMAQGKTCPNFDVRKHFPVED